METKNILILGAGGAIAQHVIKFLKNDNKLNLTLFARDKGQLENFLDNKISIVTGDVMNDEQLNNVLKGQDIVYANLSGEVDKMAAKIISAMQHNSVSRLIFVTSLGIYNEIPGEFGKWNNRMIGSELVRYRNAADIIESSEVNYTIIRPSWLTNKDEIEFETTQKGEPFLGTEVARKAVARYISDIIENPEKDVNASVGLNKPGVYGNKPDFY
ncbi:NAD(P)H-binding protein [Flavobacterium sp. KACC 22763]|uniref:NAD(P)H-binding protein n=1 Tax=Flavobacterium sp. KACC 22763 TaxID=3025668 RepID=UPI002366ED61|nr:NAD(P)H-binding protein [Flavobacterium sp. KACC 22763]WDF65521.1 NAD(P)H-binding protein [Flavobacterium sp. KACC 22763]